MNPKIKQFMLDTSRNEAVRNQLTKSFLRKRADRDVQILAAQQLAVEFLNDAWDDMKRLQNVEEPTIKKQIGV